MNGFERRTNLKKNSIRQAALTLFRQYGIAKVNMNEIARQAKVAPATLFNYFGSKLGLIEDLLTELMDRQLERHEAVWGSDRPFPDKMKRLLLGEADILKEISFAYQESGVIEHEAILDLFARYQREKVMPFYLRLIHAGQAEGHIPSHYSVQSIVDYLDMYRNQTGRLFETAPVDERGKRLEDFVELFFYGLNGPRQSGD